MDSYEDLKEMDPGRLKDTLSWRAFSHNDQYVLAGVLMVLCDRIQRLEDMINALTDRKKKKSRPAG